jgi:hypothetical protein
MRGFNSSPSDDQFARECHVIQGFVVGPDQVLTSDGPKLTIGGVTGIHNALSKLDRQID